MNRLTQALVQHAYRIAEDIGAKAVMFDAEALQNNHDLPELVQGTNCNVVLVMRAKEPLPAFAMDRGQIINIPKVPLTRLSQIKIAVLVGVAEKLFTRGDLIVCLSGVQSSDRLDLMAVIKVGDEPEFFMTDEAHPLPPDVQPAVFEKMLSIASELAAEGREHRAVGAIFVIGDSERVLEHSRQLVFNPFHGYPEEDRNVLTGALDETIKEFAAIDGAFVIRGDGVVLAAGRYLMPTGKAAEPLRAGLGARHEAAAAITAVTDAVAITLSQSTSTVTVFNSGQVMTEIEKIRTGGGE